MVGKLLTHGYIPMEVNVVVSDWGEVDLLRVGQVKVAGISVVRVSVRDCRYDSDS
jgi:hypothetical protein